MESTRTASLSRPPPPPPPPRLPSSAEYTKPNPSMSKRHRGDMVDSPSKIAKSGDDTVESTTEFAKPLYLVAALWAKQQPQSYSVFMVDAAAVAGGNDDPPGVRSLGDLPGAQHGMSFVTAHSEHGTWIFGVGGPKRSTIIYDPRSTPTAGTICGPGLAYPKDRPILISHGGEVYALSRRPKVHRESNLDFPPWFLSLSFKKGAPCIYRNGCPSWKALPSPPCFPCLLDPWEYRYPPDISVSSYAAFGSHILLSLQQEETGTYAFHVVEKKWEKVSDKNLPFVGQAVPIGGSLFAACRVMPNNGPVTTTVFHMSIEVSTPAVPGKLATSSIREFPVASDGEIPRPLLCPLGRGSFCSLRVGSCRQSRKGRYMKDMQIMFTAFQMDNVDAILTACQTKNAKAKDLHGAVLQVKQENQIYKFKRGSRFLASLHMPVIAALSMDMTY